MNTDFVLTLSIVSHGDVEKVHRLLASLEKSEPGIANFQLIITDNLQDNLPDFDPAPWGQLNILRNKKQLGFAENHNRAFEHARGEYFAILNPDLIFERPIFDQLINSLKTNKASLIAPVIVDENGVHQDSFRALPTPIEMIRRRLPGYTFSPLKPDYNSMIHPDWIAGMFWLMLLPTYRDLGGMDEKFFLYLEDVDFCTRARLRGMKILVDSNIHIIHEAKRSSRKSLKYLFLHLQSALLFFTSSVYWQALKKP